MLPAVPWLSPAFTPRYRVGQGAGPATAGVVAGAEVAANGERTPRPIRIVRADDAPRELDLAVIAPGPELGALAKEIEDKIRLKMMPPKSVEEKTA